MSIELKVTTDTPNELRQTLVALGAMFGAVEGAVADTAEPAAPRAARTRKAASEPAAAAQAETPTTAAASATPAAATTGSEPAGAAAASSTASASITPEELKGLMAKALESNSAAAVQQALFEATGFKGITPMTPDKYEAAKALLLKLVK